MNTLNKELSQTEKDLRDKTNVIEKALLRLNKANLLLGDWTQEYGFVEKPDPRAAVECFHKVPLSEINSHQEQSLKWFYEYEKIYQFIDMAQDYVCEASRILNKSIEV